MALTSNVYIDATNRVASGIISNARNSPGFIERISCSVYGIAGGFRVASCTCTDLKSNMATCSSIEPTIVDAIAAVKGDSNVQMNWDATGHCTQISTVVDSAYVPKAP